MAFGIKHKVKKQKEEEQKSASSAVPDAIKKPGIWIKIKSKINGYKRVLKITTKPSSKEFSMTAKVTALGTALMGVIGFLVWIILTFIIG